MWINDEVDLPQTLITAQRQGRLVIFAGAGVSMGPPSNLPSFEDLANDVAQGVLLRKRDEHLDAFLGRVEQHGVDVQARTRKIINVPTSGPRGLHHSLVKLFRDVETFRLVTTNFDPHFTTAAKVRYPAVDIFIAPALPLGRDFSGLVYLHGAVENPRSRLVLTDADFGRAYLADGWATRFLMEMFRKYAVLFVGYSHQDPVMRYLARSFVGGTERYSLTPAGRDEFWTNLGITPVHFPLRVGSDEYGAIDAALASWSKRASMGAFDHKARITQLAEALPPMDEESVDYLRSALADCVTLKFFTGTASSVEWLRWVEDEGLFGPLLAAAPIRSDEPSLLAYWFADRYAVQHLEEALEFVQRHAPNLNPELARAIVFRLALRDATVPADTLRLWAAALLAVRTTPTESLTRLLTKCADTGVIDAAALLFRFLLRPQLEFEHPWPRPDLGEPFSLSAEIALGGEEYHLRRVWDTALKGHIEMLHAEFLPMVEEYLNNAWALLRIAGCAMDDWDPMSFRRSAVGLSEQRHASHDWGLLVDVARDVIEWAVEHRPVLAHTTIEAWISARPQLLNRLAIHATTKRKDLAPDYALALVERHHWLYATSLKHETFALLEHVFPNASEHAQRRFIAHSMTAPVLQNEATDAEAKRTADYERYNLAVWLRRVAPGSQAAIEHFDELQAQNPEFRPRDHPDMDRWISVGSRGPRSPITVEELLGKTSAEAAMYVTQFTPEKAEFDQPDRDGLLTIFEQAVTRDVDWSLAVAGELVARDEWKPDVWRSLLAGWRGELGNVNWHAVTDLLDCHAEIARSAPMAVASVLEQGIRRKDLEPADIDKLERISDGVLTASDAGSASVELNSSTDWLARAINRPAGQVALMWLRALSYRMAAAGDAWEVIPDPQRHRFETLIGGGGNNAEMARVVFASQLHFLFHADRLWTETHIVPLFDWAADQRRAAQAWDGFLTWGQWNDALFKQMEPFVRQTFTRMNELGRDAEAFVSRLAAVAAFSPGDPWRAEGWLFDFIRLVAPEHRARLAEQFGRYVESLTPDGRDSLWDQWLEVYWDDRITGLPQQLCDLERQAMVGWMVPLGKHAPEVVDRILRAPPTRVDSYTFYRLKQSELVASCGAEVGRMLQGLLGAVKGIDYDTGEVAKLATAAFHGGASVEDLLAVADEMARLNLGGAEQLRTLVAPAP